MKGVLGSGAFGVVLLVQNRMNLEDSALKIINKTRLSPEALDFLATEAFILKTLSIPAPLQKDFPDQ
jgi:hypothetical protein